MGIWRQQNSFVGGEISPRLFGRTDLNQYGNSLATLLNFTLHPHGGASRRGGTKYVCAVKDSSKATRLIPFEYSASLTYVLEVGENYIRFVKNGSQLLDPVDPVEVVTTFSESELFDIHFCQLNNAMWLVHPDHAPVRLSRDASDETSWSLTDEVFTDGPYGLLNPTTTTLGVSAASGAGITVTASAITGINNSTGFQTTDVGRLVRIFNETDALWGWGIITARTSTTVVTVTHSGGNDFDTVTATTLWKLGRFSDTTGYPATLTMQGQRLCYGGSAEAPQAVDMSSTDLFTDFTVGSGAEQVVVASDACQYTLVAEQANPIRWLAPVRDLCAGTAGGEWSLPGGGGAAITPSNPPIIRRDSSVGASTLQPVHTGGVALFVSRTMKALHEMAYVFEADGYRSPNLTLLAEHLLRNNTLVDLDFQRAPDSIVWCIRNDGAALALTYMREQEVVGWARHTTDGLFESVCCVLETDRDVPYFIVNRTINSATVRYIEYMADNFDGGDTEDAYLVDAGITYDSTAETTITGLNHLEGESVDVLADGMVVTGKTVDSGQIVLSTAASKVHVGLNYNSDMESLPVEIPEGMRSGSSMGRQKVVPGISLKLSDTVALQVGPDDSNLDDVIFNEGQEYGTALAPFTGEKTVNIDGGHGTDRRVFIRQNLPLPCTVNALVAEIEVTG